MLQTRKLMRERMKSWHKEVVRVRVRVRVTHCDMRILEDAKLSTLTYNFSCTPVLTLRFYT